MDNNRVTLVGNVGKDPESRTISSGSTVNNFSVATNKKFTDKNGEEKEINAWHNVVYWGELNPSIKKGSRVVVLGELQTRSYEDNLGDKKYVTEIVAQVIGLVQ